MRLFGLDSFSHQSSASSTFLLSKGIYPRKSITKLFRVIFLEPGVIRHDHFAVLAIECERKLPSVVFQVEMLRKRCAGFVPLGTQTQFIPYAIFRSHQFRSPDV